MKIGLALSSGGARGFSHIGVIKVLLKHDIKIDYVAGTSMGSLVGAYFALNGEIDGLEKFVKSFNRRKVLSLVDINNPRKSLIKGDKVFSLINEILRNKRFSDTKIPLQIGATTLEEGKQVIFSKGKLSDAIRASGTFPGVFPPIKYKGKHLVDGGLSDATPVSLVTKMGADRVIAVDLFSLQNVYEEEFDMKQVIQRTYEILVCNLSKYNMKEYGDNIIVLKPKAGKRVETFNFHNAIKYIKAGEAEAIKHIDMIKRMLK